MITIGYADTKLMCSLPFVCIGFLLIIEIYDAYPFILSVMIVGVPDSKL